jgi:hypothetical protein
MIRHIFIAALRNMAANKLISAIAILGPGNRHCRGAADGAGGAEPDEF